MVKMKRIIESLNKNDLQSTLVFLIGSSLAFAETAIICCYHAKPSSVGDSDVELYARSNKAWQNAVGLLSALCASINIVSSSTLPSLSGSILSSVNVTGVDAVGAGLC